MKPILSELLLHRESDSPPDQSVIQNCYVEEVDEIVGWFEKARERQDSASYGALHSRVDDLRSDLRESIQALTREQMWEIICNLRRDETLDRNDLSLIRLWMVGDADAYVAEENNFDEWLEEVERLGGEIKRLRTAPIATDELDLADSV